MDFGPLVRALSDWFANSFAIAAVCAGLGLGAVAVWVIARNISTKIVRDARDATAAIRTGDDLGAAIESLRDSPLRLVLRQELRQTTTLDGGRYRFASHADRFAFLPSRYADFRNIDSAPNVFIGLGLFLTFVGLALSLMNASIGASSGDITIVKQSVTTLLEFSAAKFSTSLTALACSIVLGFALRKQRHRIDRALRDLKDALDEECPVLTPERVALYALSEPVREHERAESARATATALLESVPAQLALQHLEDVLAEAKEQTAQLTSFNSGLAIQLGEALDRKLEPMLAHLADRLEIALRQMGGSIGASNQTALKELLESFVGELRSTTRTDSEQLQHNIQRLATDLAQTSRELSDRMGALFSGLESTGERFAGFLAEAGGSFREEIGRVQADIGVSLSSALSALNDAAARSSRESEAMLAKLSESASSFKDSVEGGASTFTGELDRGARSIDAVVDRFGATVERLEIVVDRSAAFAEASSRRTGEGIAALQATIAGVDNSFRRVSEASEPFGRAAEHVRGAIDLLRLTQEAVQAKVAGLESAAAIIAGSSETLASSFSRDVSRLSDGLGSTTERLTNAITSIAQQSESAGSLLAETIRHTLEEYERRFAGVDRDLQSALDVIVATFSKTYEEIRERVNVVDQQFADSVNKLASFNDKFGESADDLSEGVHLLSKLLSSRA